MRRIFIFFAVAILTSVSIVGTAYATGYLNSSEKSDSSLHMVSLLKDRAEPGALFIKQGEFVQFNSKDGKSHHLSPGTGTAKNLDHEVDSAHEHTGKGVESGVFGPDEGYRVQFKKTGTYEFHDHNNPDIHTTVVVYIPKEGK